MSTPQLTDELTGAFTRSFLDDALTKLFAASGIARRGVLILLDIDKFAALNEEKGRSSGDLLLTAVRERIGRIVGVDDIVARYGADAFGVLCSGATADYGAALAQRFRARVADIPFEITQQRRDSYFFTVSVGVASFPAVSILSPGHLCAAAEQALARAKSEGGNRVRAAASA
jgi:diguanylate cyclase (GGDEF)-like protein